MIQKLILRSQMNFDTIRIIMQEKEKHFSDYFFQKLGLKIWDFGFSRTLYFSLGRKSRSIDLIFRIFTIKVSI